MLWDNIKTCFILSFFKILWCGLLPFLAINWCINVVTINKTWLSRLETGSSITVIFFLEVSRIFSDPKHNWKKYKKAIKFFSPSLKVLKTLSVDCDSTLFKKYWDILFTFSFSSIKKPSKPLFTKIELILFTASWVVIVCVFHWSILVFDSNITSLIWFSISN